MVIYVVNNLFCFKNNIISIFNQLAGTTTQIWRNIEKIAFLKERWYREPGKTDVWLQFTLQTIKNIIKPPFYKEPSKTNTRKKNSQANLASNAFWQVLNSLCRTRFRTVLPVFSGDKIFIEHFPYSLRLTLHETLFQLFRPVM